MKYKLLRFIKKEVKDILESKIMILFILFVLGITYYNACLEQKKDDSSELVERQVIISNFEK